MAYKWAICPRCNEENFKKLKEMTKAVKAAYGKVSLVEFNKLSKEAEDFKDQLKLLNGVDERFTTLHEVHEQGIHDDEYCVSYRGSCKVCNFKFEYTYSQKV